VCPCKSSCFECRLLFLMMQNLANTAWAFAKLGFFDSKLFDALSSQALTVAPQLERQDLSHVTWAVCHAYTAQPAAQGIGNSHPTVAPAYLNMLILSSIAAGCAACDLACSSCLHCRSSCRRNWQTYTPLHLPICHILSACKCRTTILRSRICHK